MYYFIYADDTVLVAELAQDSQKSTTLIKKLLGSLETKY